MQLITVNLLLLAPFTIALSLDRSSEKDFHASPCHGFTKGRKRIKQTDTDFSIKLPLPAAETGHTSS